MQHHIIMSVLTKNKAFIITNNNALVSGILGEKFKMEIIVPQRSK